MSLSAPAATSSSENNNKLPEVATDEELKSFFSSSKRFQPDTNEEANLDMLKAVFAAPSLSFCNGKTEASLSFSNGKTEAKVTTDKLTTANGNPSLWTPEMYARLDSIKLDAEEEQEEKQRARELRHNVAIRRANLSFQCDMHPLLIRATCAKFLARAEVLQRKIDEAVKDKKVEANVFLAKVLETLAEVRKKLDLLMTETGGSEKLPSPADLAAQTQQVLGTLAETFGITDLTD